MRKPSAFKCEQTYVFVLFCFKKIRETYFNNLPSHNNYHNHLYPFINFYLSNIRLNLTIIANFLLFSNSTLISKRQFLSDILIHLFYTTAWAGLDYFLIRQPSETSVI